MKQITVWIIFTIFWIVLYVVSSRTENESCINLIKVFLTFAIWRGLWGVIDRIETEAGHEYGSWPMSSVLLGASLVIILNNQFDII